MTHIWTLSPDDFVLIGIELVDSRNGTVLYVCGVHSFCYSFWSPRFMLIQNILDISKKVLFNRAAFPLKSGEYAVVTLCITPGSLSQT